MFNVVVPNEKNAKNRDLLELIGSRCAPDELHSLANALLFLADTKVQNWSAHSQSVFNWRREVFCQYAGRATVSARSSS